jgi:hypothetical protein
MRSASTLRRRLLTRDARVAVVGQGYVGLSLPAPPPTAGFTSPASTSTSSGARA